MRLFISAGEISGDAHAAHVIQALRERNEDMEIAGIAGPQMVQAGCRAVIDMHELNVMGITDVMTALPRIRKVQKKVLHHVAVQRPDVAILIDYPGFHMQIGRRLKAMGMPVIQYIAPKLWAWGAWRSARLKQSQDRLACILPFEPAWFAKRGITAEYVGNPSAVACAGGWSKAELKNKLGVEQEAPLLALLPGSRPQELDRHLVLLVDAWRRTKSLMPEVEAVAVRAPGVEEGRLKPLAAAGVHIIERMQAGFALRADAAVAVSGTATLELALWDVPSVLIYRSSPLTVFLARRLVKLNCAGLANILLGDVPIMPELIQEQATVDNIVAHVLPLLQNGDKAAKQRQAFAKLKGLLGDNDPAQEVARIAFEMCCLP